MGIGGKYAWVFHTPQGKAYLHYVFKDKVMGELVRVLPHFYSQTPDYLGKLAESEERFMVFFPVSVACRRKLIENVGHFDLKNFVKPNLMRNKHLVRGEFLGWHLIDTNTMHHQLVKNLSAEQKKLSPWGIWNDTLLIERLASGWKLEEWE